MPVGYNVNIDPLAVYDRFAGQDSGSAGDDARFMNDFAWKQSLRNEQFQHQLAEHGIKMRVDDAVSAGLHPLVGAGINPASGGWSGPAFVSPPQKYPHQSTGASFGANISRAATATMTTQERMMQEAELAHIKANTAESFARKALADKQLAELNKTPPFPAPPPKYIQVINEHGDRETIMNPDIAAGYTSDPLNLWGNSFRKAFGGPDTIGLQNRNRSNPYGPGGYLYNIRTGGKK